jgi:DNA modification methylase
MITRKWTRTSSTTEIGKVRPSYMSPHAVMGSEMIDPDERNRDYRAYEKFLDAKRFTPRLAGLTDIPALNPSMFPHQADVTRWALRLGRAAAFLGTGMGKSLIEEEWARVVAKHTGSPVLIMAPLAVAHQLIGEAKKFGIDAVYQKSGKPTAAIVVTNYERLDGFDPAEFAGVALDESSILKSFDGKTRSQLIESFRETPYKLCGTATPAPNDHMELGNHAEFLGVMTATEMLSMFFVHDGGETQKWRLKGHARKEFWKWVCSWAVNMRKPSDIGYPDGPFILPPLIYHEHIVQVDKPSEGMLFAMPAATLSERLAARRSTVEDRVKLAAEIIAAEPEETWIAWTNLNTESEMLSDSLIGAVELTGSDPAEEKTQKSLDFADGKIKTLVTKCSIAGFGMNYQVCSHQAFVGVNDSWEQFYQAIRRCWRFGQTRPVNAHIIAASTEGNVLENLKRKEREAEEMSEEMLENMQELTRMNLKGTTRTESAYTRRSMVTPNWTMHLADCVDLARELPSDSIHYSVYSPPFQSLYTYSNSERDLGNSRDAGEFWEHYKFLIAESYRAMMSGRLVSIHCMNLPTSKVRDGHIGLRDFRGEIIKAFEDAGFIYHSEVCIWKDPVTAMQRTKALGLLHKQIKKDSCMSRQGVPDYLVTMRKPGDNPERVTNTNESFPVQLWQQYASPIWMDINPSDTLQYRSAREHNDERHICPLQLEVIRRAVKLWSNPGDVVWSPFAGIGSEGFVALEMGRKFLGSELKASYYGQALRNLGNALSQSAGLFALTEEPAEETA